jgi:hypothetical protein
MLIRLKRTIGAFLAVMAAFWTYRLVAEPFIEPKREIKRVAHISTEQRQEALQRQLQNRLGGYLRFFPDGAWERDNPFVLENENSKILLKEYEAQPDGSVKITPCTVIYLPEGEAESADSRRRVIIMQAPQGAILQFDEPVDISRGKFGRPQGGQLLGPITIQSAATRPQGGDDLYVTTHDVKMTDNLISTPNEVDFRFGQSYGHGRNMRIELQARDATPGSRHGPGVGAMQSLELTNDVTMHLQSGSAEFVPGDRPGAQGERSPQAARAANGRQPADIRCQGPFQFDMVTNVASFHDQVLVLRPNPVAAGPEDEMRCELLSIFFEQRQNPSKGSQPNTPADANEQSPDESSVKARSSPQLEARRMEAQGNPVIVHAPSNGLEGRFQQIVYDPARDGRQLGYLDSQGPGWVSFQSSQDPGRRFEARWSRELKMRPQDENHVVSLVGDAHASATGEGEISAEAIHLWLYESSPQSAGQRSPTTIQPVKMLADGDVHLESPQLSGAIGRLEAWFRQANATETSNSTGIGPNRNDRPSVESENQRTPPHYEIKHGKLLQAWFVTQPPREGGPRGPRASAAEPAALEQASIEGDVCFVESPTATNQKPLEILGDQVQIARANAPNAVAKVSGRPAKIAAQGMTMIGQTVQFDRGTSSAWIDGPGQMTYVNNQSGANDPATLPANRDVNDPFGSMHGTLVVDWKGSMKFDGQTARFDGDVVGRRTDGEVTQTMHTPLMEVTLHERADFNSPRSQGPQQPRSQVELVRCLGDVLLENRGVRDGSPIAIDQMQVHDLIVNQISGELTGSGPGRVLSWRKGSMSDFSAGGMPSLASGPRRTSASAAAVQPATAQESGAKADRDGIRFTDVQFQQGITGNIIRRELTFHQQVRCIFGPVPNWESQLDLDDPHGLAPNTMSLTCDQLTANEMGPRSQSQPPVEMEAQGNTHIEGLSVQGDMFMAQANRLTYSQAKDMIVLMGDGRSDAELVRQERPGAPQSRTAAQTIKYWPTTTKRVEIDGGHFGEGYIGPTQANPSRNDRHRP